MTYENLRNLTTLEALRKQAYRVSDTIRLNNNPETLWPFISNTDSINNKLGLAPTQNNFTTSSDGNSELHVHFKNLGLSLAYEELPFEWTAPHYLRVERIFTKGPFKYFSLETILKRTPESHSEVVITLYVLAKFANGLFKKAMQQNLKNIIKIYRAIDAKATPKTPIGAEAFLEPIEKHQQAILNLTEQWKYLEKSTRHDNNDVDSLLQQWTQDTKEQSPTPSKPPVSIAQKLAEFIYTAPDRFLSHLRPFDMANLYELDRLNTLKFCLNATENGFLNMSWDLLCPSCKGPKVNNNNMQDISGKAHCDACAIDYDLKFDENVELTFSPTEKVRPINNYPFCAGSPANTSHIVAQSNVWPKQTQELKLQLKPGRYRFRAQTIQNTLEFNIVEQSELNEFPLDLKREFNQLPELELTPSVKIILTNSMNYLQTLKVEKMAWKDNIVTAAQVTALQEFRERFSSEVLQPGLQLAISNMVILFTDLKDSTLIYDTQGDASAFNLVQTHFDMLIPIIARYEGALIKTIGDAIMAVFQNDLNALKACFEIQKQFNQFNLEKTKDKQAIIKIGFHKGPCIALNLNDKLDYFGATVNKAARVQGLSVGKDICLTEEIYNESEIQAFLKDHPHEVESFSATLKGIAGESLIYKITPTFI